MRYEYSPKGLENNYRNEKWLKKRFNEYISIGMMKFLNILDNVENAYEIKCIPQFHMEHKKGNLKSYYTISLDNKKSKWRLMIQMLDENDEIVGPNSDEKAFLQGIKKIRIKEMSEHYGKY